MTTLLDRFGLDRRRLLMDRSHAGRVGTTLPPMDVPEAELPDASMLRAQRHCYTWRTPAPFRTGSSTGFGRSTAGDSSTTVVKGISAPKRKGVPTRSLRRFRIVMRHAARAGNSVA